MPPMLVSIDPEHSRDLDDAICVTRQDDGWIVDVCLPDVASLLPAGSEADTDARRRVTTRYDADGIREGMLPAEIADASSLTPHAETPMLWCRIALGSDLLPTRVNTTRISHRTHARLSYAEADEMMTDVGPLGDALRDAWGLAARLHEKRRRRTGALFDARRGIYTTEEGAISVLKRRASHRSHMIVMEIMILANSAMAGEARRRGCPIIYRNHRPNDVSSGFRANIRRELRDTEGLSRAGAMERMRALGSMIGTATFGVSPEGHWGLDLPEYAWFTSPLRRYADIVNTRALFHGEADRDIDDTARHLDEQTRIERARSAEHHGAQSRRGIARLAERGDLHALAGYQLHTILRACAENGVGGEAAGVEITKRLASGLVDGKDLAAIFGRGREILEDKAIAETTAWVAADGRRRALLAEHLSSKGVEASDPAAFADALGLPTDALPPVDQTEDELPPGMPVNAKGLLLERATAAKARAEVVEIGRIGPSHRPRFLVRASWIAPDGTLTAAERSADTLKAAMHEASWTLVVTLGVAEAAPSTAVPSTSATQNPKSLLLETAAKDRALVTFDTLSRSGPPHAPVFTVSATWRDGKGDVKATGSASTLKAAEREAATGLLAALAEQ